MVIFSILLSFLIVSYPQIEALFGPASFIVVFPLPGVFPICDVLWNFVITLIFSYILNFAVFLKRR